MGGKGSGAKKGEARQLSKPEGANTKNILLALQAWNLPRVNTKDPAAIQERIEMYLQHCVDNDVAPTINGCAAWMGVHYTLLLEYYKGTRGTPEHQKVITKFYNVVQNVWAMDMHEGNINNITGIFLGKAFFGLKDTQEIVVSAGTAAQDRLSTAELIAESKRLPGADQLTLPEGTQTVEGAEIVVDDEPYLRTMARKQREEERKKAVEAYAPIKKEKKRQYLKQYFQDNKEACLERDRRNRAKAKARKAAEEAQKKEAQKKPDGE